MARKSRLSRRRKPGLPTGISWWKKLLRIVAVLALILVVAPFAYIYYLGGVTQIVKSELNGLSPQVSAQVGAASVKFEWGYIPISIVATDISLDNKGDVLTVPAARIGFGFGSLWNGRPSEVALQGLTLDLVRGNDGWSASPSIKLLQTLAAGPQKTKARDNATNKGDAPLLGGLKNVIILSDQVTISDEDQPDLKPFTLRQVRLRLHTDDAGGLAGNLTANRFIGAKAGALVGGSPAGSFNARFAGWPGEDNFLVDLSLSAFEVADLDQYFDAIPASVAQLGIVTGSVTTGFAVSDGPDGDLRTNIARVDTDIRATGGSVAMLGTISATEPGDTDQAKFDQASVTLSYRRAANILNVSDASISLEDQRRITFVGDIFDFHDTRPTFSGALTTNRLSLTDLYNQWPEDVGSGLRNSLKNYLSGGALNELRLQMVGAFDRETQALSIAQMDVATGFNGVRMNASAGQYKRLVGTIGGDFSLKLGLGGQVQHIGFNMNLQDGSLVLEDYPEAVNINQMTISAALKDSALSLNTLNVAFGDGGVITLDGELGLDADWKPNQLNMTLQTQRMDLGLYHAVWPNWVVPETRNWVGNKITTGSVQNANLVILTDFSTGEPKLKKLTGSLDLLDARIALGDVIPVFEDVSASITMSEAQADIQLHSAQVDKLAVQQGRVLIERVVDSPPLAKVDFNLKGELGSAIKIATSFGLGEVGVFDLSKVEATGETEMAVKLALPLTEPLNLSEVTFSVDGTVSAGSLRNLPFDADVEKAELVMSFKPGIAALSGSAELMSVPGNFSFVSNADTDKVTFIGKVLPSAAMTKKLSDFSAIEMAGDTGGSLTLEGNSSFSDMKVSLVTDMRRAAVNVPILNWAKLVGENGVASMTFDVRNGRIYSLNDIDVALGSLNAVGQAVFGEDNKLRGALFERVVWPGNDIRDLIIETGSEGEWKIGASARIIDLVPLRQNEGVGEGRPMSFDILADRIVIGQDITLQGKISGNKHAEGGGTAKFAGNLSRKNKPMITEAEINLVFGDNGEQLNGAGLIGGAETMITYSHVKDGPPILKLKSKNAGRMLNGLGITDAISSGEIVLTNVFTDGDLGNFDTDIEMTGFNVLEAPRALRMFSVLGPVGLYKLVEGEGTYFAWGDGNFAKRGSLVRLNRVRAGGDAIGLSFVGTYDTNLRQVDVSGNLVPANFVNKAVGAIPLLGKLLTGIDESGILVSQFSVTGDIDDPVTKTNAASIVPGILRDFVSPNWLVREEARILGPDNTSNDNTSDNSSDNSSANN